MHIIGYAPMHQAEWKHINVAWISERFVVEDVDLEVLDRPQENIIDKGGHIILAMEGEEVVGTCALLHSSPRVYQMVKMAVDVPWRGKGIGRALGVAIIEKPRQHDARRVMLYSNRAGATEAIDLYRKLGFKELPLPTKAYARADFQMELDLD